MTSVALLPRLGGATSKAFIQAIAEGTNPHSVKDAISYAASGGIKAARSVHDVATEIRSIADQNGFGSETADMKAVFDYEVSIYLADAECFRSAEALRDDVWAFLTCAEVLEIARWRFPGAGTERFAGGVRNVFQRLWMRGTTFDRGREHPDRWGLVRDLTEDACVAILERTSIAGDRRLALALAEGWARHVLTLRSNGEQVMRSASKLLRVRNTIIDLSSYSDAELASAIDSIFKLALQLHEAARQAMDA